MTATPKNGEPWQICIGLIDPADTEVFLKNPTISAGDFKVSTDRGAETNLDTLPSEIPAGSGNVYVDFSASEMTISGKGEVVVRGLDPGGTWTEVKIVIPVPDQNIDDLTTPTDLATSLTDVHLDHLFAVDYDPSSIPGVSGALLNEIIEDDGNGEARFTASALSQSPATGGQFVSGNWKFSTNTASGNPGTGVVRFNNSDPALVTAIFISEFTSTGFNAAEFIESMVAGDNLGFSQEDDGTRFLRTDVNGSFTDNGDWYTIPVAVVESGTLIGNNKSTRVTFGKPAVTASVIAAEVDTVLTSAHGSGAWTTATGFNTVVPMTAALSQIEHDATQTLITGLNNISSANVLTQVNVGLDASIPELAQGVPAVTPSLRTAAMLKYMALRNKTDVQTSGTDALEIHNDAGTLITKKLLTDDGADYSEAKMISGP